jgi:hypothetical protein
MNLYHLTQNEVDDYDTYSDAVVAAESAEQATHIHPCPRVQWAVDRWMELPYGPFNGEKIGTPQPHGNDDWPLPSKVVVRLIGKAEEDVKAGVICASYHAG